MRSSLRWKPAQPLDPIEISSSTRIAAEKLTAPKPAQRNSASAR
jgi:hypothetical protein